MFRITAVKRDRVRKKTRYKEKYVVRSFKISIPRQISYSDKIKAD